MGTFLAEFFRIERFWKGFFLFVCLFVVVFFGRGGGSV